MLEIGVLVVCAVVGWFGVSWVINLVRQQRAPPMILHEQSSQAPPQEERARGASLADLAQTWHTLLEVREDASVEEIETAYHQRVAEFDAARFAEGVGTLARQEAERQRAAVEEAYNFIRTIRR